MQIHDKTGLESVFAQKKGTVVFFYQEDSVLWEKVQPMVKAMVHDFSDQISFCACDIAKSTLWEELHVVSSPSMIYFYKGQLYVVERYIPESDDVALILESIEDDSAQEDIEFVAKVKQAVDSETLLGDYYGYIGETTTNGTIQKLFTAMDQEARRHARMLQEYIERFNGEIYRSRSEKIHGAVGEPESFSLLGAVKMALKLEKQSSVFYKRMAVLTDDDLFKQLVKEEKDHIKVLRKEGDFLKDKEILEEIDIQVQKKLLDDTFK